MSRTLEVPYSELGDLTKKHPVSLSVLRVGDSPKPGAGSSAVECYAESRRAGQLLNTSIGTKSGSAHRNFHEGRDKTPKDTTFARWETVTLPQGTGLEKALSKIVQLNSDDGSTGPGGVPLPSIGRGLKAPILKIRLRFSDNSEAAFVRQDAARPQSLRYFGFFSADECAFRSDMIPVSVARTGGGFSTQFGKSRGGSTVSGNPMAAGFGQSTSAAFTATRRAAGKPNNMDIPQRAERRKLFDRFDPNGNGMLSLAELDKAVGELWPHFDNKPALMRAYKLADFNGTGFVSYTEFGGFLIYLANFNQIWKSFMSTDADGDRRIEEDEFIGAAARLEPAKTEQQLRAEFKKLDKNGGGYVLFGEFCDKFAQRANALGYLEPTPINRVRMNASRAPRAEVTKTDPYFGKKYTLAMPEKKRMKEIFERFDPNGNGLLSLAELDKGVLELWPRFNNKPALMRAYKAADANNTGFVSKREFEFFVRFLVHFSNLWSAFQGTDTSNDRRISLEEFLAARERLGVGQSEQEAREAFAMMDANRGGVVLFEEFCNYMAKHKAAFELNFTPPPRTRAPCTVSGTHRGTAAGSASAASTMLRSFDLKKTGLRAQVGATVRGMTIPDKAAQRKLFDRFDPNGNGMLSLAELDKAVGELWPQFDNKPALMRAYKASDKNGTGFVSKREFGFFLHYLLHFTTLWEAFEHVDKSDDRRVSLEEFIEGAAALGVRKTQPELERMFKMMDRNGGGLVLFDEFCAQLGKIKAEESS